MDLYKTIISEFFGDNYRAYFDFINAIRSCSSLKDFNKLRVDFSADVVDKIFDNANRAVMTDTRPNNIVAKDIFNKLKPVQTDTSFI